MIIIVSFNKPLYFKECPKKDGSQVEFMCNELHNIIEYTKDLFNNDLHIVLKQNGKLIHGTVKGEKYEIIVQK